jgi:hypothetical protein
MSREKDLHTCDECGNSYTTREKLLVHEVRAHE